MTVAISFAKSLRARDYFLDTEGCFGLTEHGAPTKEKTKKTRKVAKFAENLFSLLKNVP